jgi:tetratricopeptide (TPR) repeat protein
VRDRLGVGTAAREFDLAGTLTDSTEAYRQYTAGELAFHAFDWAEAIKHFEAALRLDPTFAWAYYRLGMVESWSGTLPEGRPTAYERGVPYIERLPGRWQSVYTATLDYERGNPDPAIATIERLLRDEPDIPDAYNLLGELQTHSSRYVNLPAAIRNFETALDIDPTFKIVFFHLVDGYMLHGDEAALDRLIDRSALGDDPDHPWISYVEMARAYIRDQPEEVVRHAEQLDDLGGARFYKGASLMRLGHWDRFDAWVADDVAKRAGYVRGVTLSAGATGAYSRGRFNASRADFEGAISLLGSNLSLMSFSADWSVVIGHLNDLQGRTREAEESHRRAFEVDKHWGTANWALGRFLVTQGHLEQARHILTGFERGLPADPDALNHCWAHLLRGEILLGEGDAAGAREAVSRLRPESCWIHDEPSAWIRAESYELEGDFAAAARAWHAVIEPVHPRYPCTFSFEIPAWHQLGGALERAGDPDRAKEAYRRVLDAWGDGDDGIPAVDDARTRLAALGG